MGCYKLDKLDKIVIALTFIIVTFCCVFNTFSYASEDSENVLVSTVANIKLDMENNIFTSNTGSYISYFPVEKGYKYYIKYTSAADRNFVLSENYPTVGESFKFYTTATAGTDVVLEYLAEDDLYLYMSYTGGYAFTVTREPYFGLTGTVKDLVSNVGITNIWSVFETLTPFVLLITLFALGFWFISHNILEHSKGRDF